MIGVGAFSPLAGFMGEADYQTTRERMRLANGLPWTIPVTLAVTNEEERDLHAGDDVVLLEDGDHPLGILHLAEKYTYDKKREAAEVYGTTEEAHPGVRVIYDQGDVYLGGKITLLERPSEIAFPNTGSTRSRPAPSSSSAAGSASSPSRLATPCIAPTSTSRSAPWRSATRSCSTRSSARPRATTSPPPCAWSATKSCSPLLPQRPCRALGAARQYALRRPA